MVMFPVIGTRLKLSRPWEFRLFRERRNSSIYEKLGYTSYDIRMPFQKGHDQWMNFVLPIDTILKVDRIYIKKATPDFNSITFFIESTSCPELKGKKSLRFWAKVDDINGKMEGFYL